jgi:hypothetical protein
MADIRFKNGLLSGLPAAAVAEPLFVRDVPRLYIGNSGGNQLVGLLHKINGTVAPTVNDDAGDGFSEGSTWIDTTNDNAYECVDATVGSAIWRQIGTSGITQLTGDVTAGPGTGSQVATIANDAVTYAKLQNVSATLRVIGRKGAGPGDAEECTLSDVLDFIGSAAQGDILYRGSSAWARLPAGTSGQFLKTLGASFDPAWDNIVASSAANSMLHNGDFQIWQRGTSFSAVNRAYGPDRWYALVQGANQQFDIVSTGAAGLANLSCKCTQTQVTAARHGICQLIESNNTTRFRGRAVRFQFSIKADASRNFRAAIIEWTGTANAPDTDPINSWTSSTYTTGNFFKATTTTVTAVSGSLAVTTVWQTFSVSGTVSSSANNIYVMVWSEGTTAQNGTFTITECGLYDGNTVQSWFSPRYEDVLAQCQRYFISVTSKQVGLAFNTSTLYTWGSFDFPVTMVKAPSLWTGFGVATFTVNAGLSGTVQLQSPTTNGCGFTNSANNWTVNAVVWVNCYLTAEF